MKLFSDVNYDKLYFTTSTIQGWFPLLIDDKFKLVILQSFSYLTLKNKVRIYAFVIMDNHIHVVWEIINDNSIQQIRQPFLKYTAQQFKFILSDSNDPELENFKVYKHDRKYQFWKANPKDIQIKGPNILLQKIQYIHNNLNKKGDDDLEYPFSSARSYYKHDSQWSFLNVIKDFAGENTWQAEYNTK